MHFAGIAHAAGECTGPSARKMRGPQDDNAALLGAGICYPNQSQY
jgi:hypothetical protein